MGREPLSIERGKKFVTASRKLRRSQRPRRFWASVGSVVCRPAVIVPRRREPNHERIALWS